MGKPRANHSFTRAIRVFGMAIIVTALMEVLTRQGLIPASWKHLFMIAGILGTIGMAQDIKYWNTEYIIGWVVGIPIGIYMMIQSGFLSMVDILLYSGVTGIGLYFKYGNSASGRPKRI